MPLNVCIRRKEPSQSGSCTPQALRAQGASAGACRFHGKSVWERRYCVLGQEEEGLEDEEDEGAKWEYLDDGQYVEFNFEEDGEDEPLGA
jgi:hypothetical protein